MARTLQEIKNSITQKFMSENVIRDKYGLTSETSFDSTFSKVSLENILFSVIATAIYALESIFEQFKKDVDGKIASAVVASIPWYHRICLEYQDGDELVYDETTCEFHYADVDESKQIVKYAAVREYDGEVKILVSGDSGSGPEALSNAVRLRFKSYLNKRKPAGIATSVSSFAPDVMRIQLAIEYDDQVLDSNGGLISDPSVKPVEDAVKGYLRDIVYGGIFNKTKLVDAIQRAEGVKDVSLLGAWNKPAEAAAESPVTGNNCQSASGSFKMSANSTFDYVLQL